MTGVQRFLTQPDNLVAAGTVTADSVQTSAAIRTESIQRSGSGRIKLVGQYTGHADAGIDIEIFDGGATQRASSPTFSGVGNGALTVIGVDAAATSQALEYTLVDLGTQSQLATLAIEGVEIESRAGGAAGNDLRITVMPSLTEATTSWSLLADWTASTVLQTGPQWDFGALPLLATGEMNPATPRIRFAHGPDVYRQYKQFKDGAWQYGLSPALRRDIKAETPISTITGGYTVTVTDGVTTETYTALVTFYDICVALSGSSLVRVVGVVAADRTPGGMMMVDVPLRTSSWVLSQTGVAIADVAPAPQAPTEIVTISCINADSVGAETWQIDGTVSGSIGLAQTGIPFASGVIDLTVPDKSGPAQTTGNYTTNFVPVARATGEFLPSVCMHYLELGINARPGTYSFTYTERPPNDNCDCKTAQISGQITEACLGLAIGGDMPTALNSEYKARLGSLHSWRANFIDANIVNGTDLIVIDDLDVNVCNGIVKEFQEALSDGIYADAAALAEYDNAFTAMQTDMSVWMHSSSRIGYIEEAKNAFMDSTLTYSGNTPNYASTTTGQTLGPTTSLSNFMGYTYRVEKVTQKYRARMDYVRTLAGIVPKSSASNQAAGDGCWRDDPSAAFWWVDDSGAYFPCFSNVAYISSKPSCGSGASADIPFGQPYSTMEFGFALGVGCIDRLKVGDKITVTIESIDGARPYSVGATATINVVNAGPAYLSGGVSGDGDLTWSVVGSVDGILADYALGPSESSYHYGGAEIVIHRGGIPYVLGDRFQFQISAEQFKWRKDGGAWSGAIDIDAGLLALSDGLSAQFTPGAAPSWVNGDAWTFSALQPAAPGNLIAPDSATWSWLGSGGVLIVDMGSNRTIGAVALARYDLPAGATVLIEGGDGLTWPESQAMDLSGQVSVVMLDIAWSVSHLRLTVAGATAGQIGWLWAGLPLATTYSAAQCRVSRAYSFQNGEGINPSRAYLGQGAKGIIAWDADILPLLQPDLDAILARLDAMLMADHPMIVVPHYMHPDEAALMRVDVDSIAVTDIFEFQPDDSSQRQLSLSMAVSPVFQ